MTQHHLVRYRLQNKTLPVKTLASNPIRTFNGSTTIRIFHKNHGMHSTTDNVTIAGVAAGTYNGITHDNINNTYTSIKNITLDSYDVVAGGELQMQLVMLVVQV